jgi:hypothetical protein
VENSRLTTNFFTSGVNFISSEYKSRPHEQGPRLMKNKGTILIPCNSKVSKLFKLIVMESDLKFNLGIF